MAEQRGDSPFHPAPVPGETRQYDYEIQFKTLVILGVGLLVTCAVSMVIVFFLFRLYDAWGGGPTGPQLPLAEEVTAAEQVPGARLLAEPEAYRAEVDEEERTAVEGYGWVDQQGGVASIPLDRALELALANRLVSGAEAEDLETGVPPRATGATLEPEALAPGAAPADEAEAGPRASPAADESGFGATGMNEAEEAPAAEPPGAAQPRGSGAP